MPAPRLPEPIGGANDFGHKFRSSAEHSAKRTDRRVHHPNEPSFVTDPIGSQRRQTCSR